MGRHQPRGRLSRQDRLRMLFDERVESQLLGRVA